MSDFVRWVLLCFTNGLMIVSIINDSWLGVAACSAELITIGLWRNNNQGDNR